jgi:hypothetical protein
VYAEEALTSVDHQLPVPIRTHPGWHVLGGLLVLSWLAVLGMMFADTAGEGEVTDLSAGDFSGVLADEEQWLGAYSQGRKLGYVHSRIQKSKDGVALEQETFLKVRLGGIKQKIVSRFKAYLGDDQKLKEFDFQFSSGVLSAWAQGRMEENRLVVKAQVGTETIRKVLPLDEPPLFDFTVLKLLAQREPEAGDRFRVTVFDPQALSNRPVQIDVVGLEAVKVSGAMEPALHIRREVAGQRVDTWIDGRGAVLEEKTAFGLALRREDRETAKARFDDAELASEVDVKDLLRLLAPESSGAKEKR